MGNPTVVDYRRLRCLFQLRQSRCTYSHVTRVHLTAVQRRLCRTRTQTGLPDHPAFALTVRTDNPAYAIKNRVLLETVYFIPQITFYNNPDSYTTYVVPDPEEHFISGRVEETIFVPKNLHEMQIFGNKDKGANAQFDRPPHHSWQLQQLARRLDDPILVGIQVVPRMQSNPGEGDRKITLALAPLDALQGMRIQCPDADSNAGNRLRITNAAIDQNTGPTVGLRQVRQLIANQRTT